MAGHEGTRQHRRGMCSCPRQAALVRSARAVLETRAALAVARRQLLADSRGVPRLGKGAL